MAVPETVYRLVERFDHNKDAYKSGEYNEELAKGDFITPLMELLGWDVHNWQDKPGPRVATAQKHTLTVGSVG